MSEQPVNGTQAPPAGDPAPDLIEGVTTGEKILAMFTIGVGVLLILIAVDSITDGAVFGFVTGGQEGE
jgi:hypothetical protein